MRDRLFSLRDVDAGEKYTVSILLVQALFLGIFIGAFDISAHSLFLSVFDQKSLATAYIFSGLAGIILLSVYFTLQANMKFSIFLLVNLIFVFLSALILWVALESGQAEWTIYLFFVMLGPLNILAVMGFRTTAGLILAKLKEKRLLVLPDTYLITGILLICFTIPLLLTLNLRLQDILLIGVLSAALAAVLQGLAGRHEVISSGNVDNQPDGFRSTVSVLNVFRDDGYPRMLGLFIILSVISAFFIQYSFLAVTRQIFPDAEKMAIFLGLFTGSIMVVTLAGKLLLFGPLMKRFGLRMSLTLSPVLLASVTAVAVAAGLLMGYTRETAGGFMIFFILLALLRFLSRSLDDAVEAPTFRLLYQTIDEKVRFGVKSVMDGAVKEAGAFLAGLILAGVGMLGFVRLLHFSWILVAVLLLWTFVAYRLYSEYRRSIHNGLTTPGPEAVPEETRRKPKVYRSRFFGERAFRMDYFNLVSGDYSVFEGTDNGFYFNKLVETASGRKDINLVPALRKLTTSRFDAGMRKRASDCLKAIDEHLADKSRDNDKLIAAKRILAGSRMPQTTEILRLLRDKSVESKRLAIYLIGKFRLSDMLPEVCECFNIPGLEMDTAFVLSAFGSEAEEELIRFYLVSRSNLNSSKTILRLLSRLPLDDSGGFLFSRLWSNSRQLKEVALNCLLDSGYKPSPEDRERLNLLISEVIGIMTWTLSAKRCLEKHNDSVLLEEITKELNRWSSFLISMLSVTYDSSVVTRIRKNLEFETLENVHYAHAMIDIVVDDSIKAKITYLLDIIPDEEKLRNLNRFFPVEIPGYERLLEDILNRDYNLLSIWIKASVLRNLPRINDNEMSESVVALLFSPETILQEEAVRLITRTDTRLYRSAYNRIPLATRKSLDRIIEGETDPRECLYDRTTFLSYQFRGIIEDELLTLARKMLFVPDIKGCCSSLPEGYILWLLGPGTGKPATLICFTSDPEELIKGTGNNLSSAGYMLSFRALDEFLYQYPDNTNVVMTCMENLEAS